MAELLSNFSKIQRILLSNTSSPRVSDEELWTCTMLFCFSDAEIVSPILQMRKTEGRGNGAPGRLAGTAAFYQPVGRCASRKVSLWVISPPQLSQEPCRPSKCLKIENLAGLKPQRMLQVPRKKGRLAVHSDGWHSNLFFYLSWMYTHPSQDQFSE